MNLVAVPLQEFCEEAAARFARRHPQRQLTLQVDNGALRLDCDERLLPRAIDNVLDNAAYYSESDKPITLHAHASDAEVSIAVVDSGVGIDQTDLERVFEPFFRSDRSRSRASGGLGLGLTLTRRIVEGHGGSVVIDSQLGAGSTVTLKLPVGKA